jgi:hypothetical protein
MLALLTVMLGVALLREPPRSSDLAALSGDQSPPNRPSSEAAKAVPATLAEVEKVAPPVAEENQTLLPALAEPAPCQALPVGAAPVAGPAAAAPASPAIQAKAKPTSEDGAVRRERKTAARRDAAVLRSERDEPDYGI